MRWLKSKGEITLCNRFFYLGHAFRGHVVGLVPTTCDGVYEVRFHAHPIGQIELNPPHSKPRGHYYPLVKLDTIL